MKFIAFSDTHDNMGAVRDLLGEISKNEVDFYVHAGDVVAPFCLKQFETLDRRLYISFGNNDGERNMLLEIAVKSGWIIGDLVQVGDLAVYHGTNGGILKKLVKKFKVVVTGHTHRAGIEKRKNGALVINPGEACGYLTSKRSYAIYEDGETIIKEF
jgi:hypothetical protein